jgi:hypothetical protein
MPMGAKDLFWFPDCNGIAKRFEDNRVDTSRDEAGAATRR